MFNPGLNPYVGKLEQHRDIIITSQDEDDDDLLKFIQHSNPLIVDLGCGAGNFLRDYAILRPESSFIGFELRYKRLVKGAIKFKKRDIKNIRLIRARAEDINLWIPEKRISELHVNFPDPWPKTRHLKHRLISREFLETVNRQIDDQGLFVFKTDHKDYFRFAVNLINQCPFLETIEYSENLHQSDYKDANVLTEFEALFRGKGFPVYYIKTKVR
jgi:tRNA (guanine-N7-)-methyltransferase